MGKIEEVARAVWAERQRSATEAGLHLREWDDETPLFREDVRREARAAIKAMKVPTESMVKAGHIPTRQIPLGNGMHATGLGLGADQSRIFDAMIDAALSEDKEQG